jgi:hypothetical protein
VILPLALAALLGVVRVSVEGTILSNHFTTPQQVSNDEAVDTAGHAMPPRHLVWECAAYR